MNDTGFNMEHTYMTFLNKNKEELKQTEHKSESKTKFKQIKVIPRKEYRQQRIN